MPCKIDSSVPMTTMVHINIGSTNKPKVKVSLHGVNIGSSHSLVIHINSNGILTTINKQSSWEDQTHPTIFPDLRGKLFSRDHHFQIISLIHGIKQRIVDIITIIDLNLLYTGIRVDAGKGHRFKIRSFIAICGHKAGAIKVNGHTFWLDINSLGGCNAQTVVGVVGNDVIVGNIVQSLVDFFLSDLLHDPGKLFIDKIKQNSVIINYFDDKVGDIRSLDVDLLHGELQIGD
mmetsp:Transcript_24523/g.21700  ORF Transcript_24523/g.21700 Transcript_24523/m.21700 type:complete len:232 (-) Transcript_24523:464-1159(-)